jgi:uncharacterized membrane protein YidH (DUF202 family)
MLYSNDMNFKPPAKNQSGGDMKKEIIDKMLALITAAFGLVAALAWNDAIKAIFATVFGQQSNIPAMVGYAVMVTIIAVAVTMWLGKVSVNAGLAEKK